MLPEGYFASELVILAFSGKSLSAETLRTIDQEKPTQFILFTSANYESKGQLIALTDEIQKRVSAYSPHPAIISADQEGGLVQRFKSDFTRLPTALTVGKASPSVVFDLGKIQARELFAAGLNLNYAPVCDIHTNPANPVIGNRAYGNTADQVTRAASAIVRGHLAEGVEACIKHFPGHGDTHVDSHESLPVVNTPIEILKTREWVPFHRAMKSGANFVMSAHILMPHLDPKFPGTFSPTFLKKYLRGELLFQGIIVSDDMQMGAVVKNYGAEEAPILALKAGCDQLCYRTEDQALIAIESIKKAIADKKLNADELKKSIDRIRKVRATLKLATSIPLSNRLQTIGNPAHQDFILKNL